MLRVVTRTQCAECGRVFDLLDDNDDERDAAAAFGLADEDALFDSGILSGREAFESVGR